VNKTLKTFLYFSKRCFLNFQYNNRCSNQISFPSFGDYFVNSPSVPRIILASGLSDILLFEVDYKVILSSFKSSHIDFQFKKKTAP